MGGSGRCLPERRQCGTPALCRAGSGGSAQSRTEAPSPPDSGARWSTAAPPLSDTPALSHSDRPARTLEQGRA